jgi:hypothetical protein
MARSRGAGVVELDMTMPFTAARARNAGFARVCELAPHVQYVQFVDGDCELSPGWIQAAADFLVHHPDIAVVAGRLREKFPQASVYNLLCDMEWNSPTGEALYCGGIAMMRKNSFVSVTGFNARLICGEEPELCSRLRAGGWRIWRLADDMALHDANMTRFSQWWIRSVRAGYSFAQAAFMDGASTNRRGLRESRSSWFWGAGIPLTSLALAIAWQPLALWILFVYPMQITRLAVRGVRSANENWIQAFFWVLGKFPEVLGQIKFKHQQVSGRQAGLIEHK